ncbi:MAG: hypothetical protein RIQ64_1393 [Actinomycetota bacterium]|jgi:hypothetical protein
MEIRITLPFNPRGASPDKGASVSVGRRRGIFCALVFVGAVALGACGGSDSESGDTTTADTVEETADTVAEDPAVKLAAFCKAAADEGINATDLADDAQVEEVAAEMKDRADALMELAATAPDEVSEASAAIAQAATSMADSLASDPTLENFNQVVEQLATDEIETASKTIDDFVAKNCEG